MGRVWVQLTIRGSHVLGGPGYCKSLLTLDRGWLKCNASKCFQRKSATTVLSVQLHPTGPGHFVASTILKTKRFIWWEVIGMCLQLIGWSKLRQPWFDDSEKKGQRDQLQQCHQWLWESDAMGGPPQTFSLCDGKSPEVLQRRQHLGGGLKIFNDHSYLGRWSN